MPVAQHVAVIRDGDKFSLFAILVDSIFLEAPHYAPVPVVHLHGHLVFLRFPLGVENLVARILTRNFGDDAALEVGRPEPAPEIVARARGFGEH